MRKTVTQVVIMILSATMILGYGAMCIAPFLSKSFGEAVTPLPEEETPSVPNENIPNEPAPPVSEVLPVPPENDNTGEEKLPEAEPEPEPMAVFVRAKANGLNLRSGPGTGYSSVGYLDKDDMVTYLSKEGNWYKTLYKNKTAYISAGSSYTELFEMPLHKNDTVEKVIEEGLRLLGFPYVYGATRLHDGSGRKLSGFDATKYDCSSLMQAMFYHGAGINLQMTTRTQVKQGTYVPRSELTRGDLMFFTNSQRYNKTGTERIGHVALYLGKNYILHTASDYAVIEQISNVRWSYYIETRRMV